MQTDKKIDQSNDIRWSMGAEIGYFIFTLDYIRTRGCDHYKFKRTEGFLQRAGVLTFLKTSTQLQIWFDDVLEVTWVYVGNTCSMKKLMAGLRFHGHLSSNYDKVSAHYRYEVELGNFTTLQIVIITVNILNPVVLEKRYIRDIFILTPG